MPKDFTKPKVYSDIPKGITVVSGDIKVISQSRKTAEYIINYVTNSNSKIIVPIAYFPAWESNLDGENYSYRVVNNGLLVNLPKGSHSLVFNFKETNIEFLSDLLSLSGVIAIIIGIILKKKSL
jgi:uncharacterized membrane protein YfhO